jgi:hypothetical protein
LKVAIQQVLKFFGWGIGTLNSAKFDFLNAIIDLDQCGAVYCLFATEVVIHHPLIDLRCRDNLINGNSVVPLKRKQANRGLEQPTPRSIWVSINGAGTNGHIARDSAFVTGELQWKT